VELSLATIKPKMLRHISQIKSWILARVKGVVSECMAVYSPGWRRKKKVVHTMSVMAQLLAVPEAEATLRAGMMEMGMGLMQLGGGSACV
jgi:hypothetical protein